jgi:tryptophanyl-tRNA synthetase
MELFRLFGNESEIAAMEHDFRKGGVGYGEFKKRLFANYWDHFAPMRARRAELLEAPDHVEQVLQNGAKKARALAKKTLDRVRHAVGLR